jgi:acyl carrier protein
MTGAGREGRVAAVSDRELTEFIEIVRANLRTARPGIALDLDSRLPELGLDSLGTVSIIMATERAFGVTFPDEALTEDTFATLGTAWALVCELDNGG